MRIAFGSQSYQHVSLPLSAQRMVNCYIEPAPPHAKTFAAVVAAFGVETWKAIEGTCRGAKVIRGVLYVVAGTGLYRVPEFAPAILLGEVSGSSRVFIEGDENNVMVVCPDTRDGFYWSGSAFAKITDTDWPGAVWLGYIDGYFIIIQYGTGKFYITANRNPASINALDFASAERVPDNLVTGIVDHGEVVLFGTESFEVFYNSGASDFPLTSVSSGAGEFGCPYPYGPQKKDNSIFFPSHDGKVIRLSGYQPQVVSTPVVEQAMQRATDRNFIGITWDEPGHSFYGIKSADFAFVYDISTGLWHERASHGHDSWRWNCAALAYGHWIIGDDESDSLGKLSGDVFTEFGDVLRAEATSPPVGEDNKRIAHSRVELVFEQGVGLIVGQGSDPQVMLQFSDDGGRTWSNEHWRSLGAYGRFKTRTVWHRMGMSRDRIYRYSITDPVRRNLILATTEAQLRAA
jgi:hypothetical protein